MSEFEKVQCTCSHGYTCRNMEDPNCCAHSCGYNELVDALNTLMTQRDALAAQLKQFRLIFRSENLSQNETAIALQKMASSVDMLPEQCLAAHDAEVAKAGFHAGYQSAWSEAFGIEKPQFLSEHKANDYAAQLRTKAGA